jgi:predicted XRE-type DNA-binding protein/putative component of toxin-antitoxin plasmid stabilization module
LHFYASVDIRTVVKPKVPRTPLQVQFGGQPKDFKPMSTVGAGVYEMRVRDASGAYRAIYVAKFEVACLCAACLPEEDTADCQGRYRIGQSPLQDDWSKAMKKKADPRLSDTRRTKGSGNVFLDLGYDPAEAKIMALRAEVMIRMELHVKAQGWSQAEAAKHLGITQPRVSRLIKGKWQDFSLDMLLTLAARAGLEPELRLAA